MEDCSKHSSASYTPKDLDNYESEFKRIMREWDEKIQKNKETNK